METKITLNLLLLLCVLTVSLDAKGSGGARGRSGIGRSSGYSSWSRSNVGKYKLESWPGSSSERSGDKSGGYKSNSSRSSGIGSSNYSSNNYESQAIGKSSKPSMLHHGGGSRVKTVGAALSSGYKVYGMERYRNLYQGTPALKEVVCYNEDRFLRYDNGTTSGTERLNYFVCPYETTDGKPDRFCCGSEFQEYCCSYWKSSKRLVAIVGIIAAIGGILIAVIFVCNWRTHAKKPARDSSGKYAPAAKSAHEYEEKRNNRSAFSTSARQK